MNIPVETIEKARAWLRDQPDVHAERIALWGVSKGAELALVAASSYEWVDRVVACVPSDVVWAGFGRTANPGEQPSSWTTRGRSLPFIPYDRMEDSLQGKLSMAGVHRRSFESSTREVRDSARIPIEKAHAKLLLMGATRDQIWPSGEMVKRIQNELSRVGRSDQTITLVFEGASHFICGVGDETTRINPVVKPEGGSPDPESSARAAAKAWAETKQFLAKPVSR